MKLDSGVAAMATTRRCIRSRTGANVDMAPYSCCDTVAAMREKWVRATTQRQRLKHFARVKQRKKRSFRKMLKVLLSLQVQGQGQPAHGRET